MTFLDINATDRFTKYHLQNFFFPLCIELFQKKTKIIIGTMGAQLFLTMIIMSLMSIGSGWGGHIQFDHPSRVIAANAKMRQKCIFLSSVGLQALVDPFS